MIADGRRWARVSIATLALTLAAGESALAKPAVLCVNPGGTGGCFSKIQDAVDATGKSGAVINVAFGSYFENVNIPKVKLTINADPNTGIFGNTTAPIFTIAAGANVTINNLQFQDTITNSSCIESHGSLTMQNCEVFLCNGTRGAAIHQVGGKLTLVNSPIDADQATENGGCIAVEGGQLNLVDSDVVNCIAGGDGGGIWLSNTKATFSSVVGASQHQPSFNIANNKATGSGGGIFASGGKVALQEAIVSNNVAKTGDGGGIKSLSPLTITDSAFAANTSAGDGGGILAQGSGMFKVTGCSFLDNASNSDGGGIAAGMTFSLLNDTLVKNSAGENGGGISAQASGKIGSLTIDANQAKAGNGGGIDVASGSVKITNTIISLNSARMEFAQDCGGSFVSQGFNLIFDTTFCSISGKTDTNIVGEDPNLGKPEHFDVKIVQEPNAGSPVLGMGGHCPKTDEVLHTRPKSRCDIGAFESP